MVYDDVKASDLEELQNCERVVKVTRKKKSPKDKNEVKSRDAVDYVILQVGIAIGILAVILAVNLTFGGEAVWSKIQGLTLALLTLG